jgi:uncharacterized coiled-coil DUF342 family protein
MIKDLKMELVEINEALETIAHTLDTFGDDPELVEQMKQLVTKRDQLITQIKEVH